MDLKKIQTFDSLIPQTPAKAKTDVGGMGPSFKDALNQVSGTMPTDLNKINPAGLKKAAEGVKFSNHAIDRMRTRGITYSPEDIAKISDAVGRAAAKGSKDSLILMNDSALIVSVKNNTVVTVMDKNALKENVFTNIDSTIVM
jgi:flagellar operon protein